MSNEIFKTINLVLLRTEIVVIYRSCKYLKSKAFINRGVLELCDCSLFVNLTIMYLELEKHRSSWFLQIVLKSAYSSLKLTKGLLLVRHQLGVQQTYIYFLSYNFLLHPCESHLGQNPNSTETNGKPSLTYWRPSSIHICCLLFVSKIETESHILSLSYLNCKYFSAWTVFQI